MPLMKSALAALLLMTSLKLALFTHFIIGSEHLSTFIYKAMQSVLVLGPLLALLLSRRGPGLLVAFYALQTAYLFANLTYYLYFRNYLHLSQIHQLWREGLSVAGGAGIPFYPGKSWVLLIDLPLVAFLAWRFREAREAVLALRPLRGVLAGLCLAGLGGLEAFNAKGGKALWQEQVHGGESSVVRRYGTLANSLLDWVKYPGEAAFIARLDHGEPVRFPAAGGPAPALITVQMEALDANIVAHRRDGEPVAPFLASLRDSALYFPFALSYHMAGGTSDCEFSMIKGAEPFPNRVAIKLRNYGFGNSVARELGRLGYATRAFHGNRKGYYSRGEAYPRMGFTRFHGMEEMDLEPDGWGAPDSAVFGRVLEAARAEPGPFWYHVITMSTHTPFDHQPSALGPGFEDVADARTRDFFRTVRYLDRSLARFVPALREARPDAWILLYGDHGPDLDNPEYRNAAVTLGGDYLEFVPLYILPPAGASASDRRTAVSFLDLAPTLLAASGREAAIRSKGEALGQGTLGDTPLFHKGKAFARDSLHALLAGRFPEAAGGARDPGSGRMSGP